MHSQLDIALGLYLDKMHSMKDGLMSIPIRMQKSDVICGDSECEIGCRVWRVEVDVQSADEDDE